MREQKHILQNIDWIMVSLFLMLVLVGWMNIYAAVYSEEHKNIFDITQNYGKQLMWIVAAIGLALCIMIIDGKFFSSFSYLIYGLILLSLVAVLFVGNEIAGSKSWFKIGEFAIQPSEFAKFATNLVIAKYLSSTDIKLKDFKTKVVAFIFILFPISLIIMQNDRGSALVYMSFVFVLYREGLSGNVLIIGFIAILLFVLSLVINQIVIISIIFAVCLILFVFIRKKLKEISTLIAVFIISTGFVLSVNYVFTNFLAPHQKTRINVLLGKEMNLKEEGYNVNQSKIAIGSGGLLGKGYLKGTQTKYNFVPEQSTDFIFCTIGEEWGFVGSIFVITLLIGLVIRIIYVAERQRSNFSRIYGYGVASILFIHIMINIGMTLGIAPVIGIPLPFISYGGSSLWAFTILLFIFIKQDAYRMQLL